MAFVSAYKSRVLYGSLGLSCYTRDFSMTAETEMLDVTVHCAAPAKAFIPGQTFGSFTASGPLDTDTTAGGQVAVLTAFKSSATGPLTFCPSGTSVGSEAMLMNALLTQYAPESPVDGTVDWSLDCVTDGEVAAGVLIEDFTAITTDTTGTSRDVGGAGSTSGGVAHLHVSAFSGLTSNAVTIEHSTTGSSGWTTLATFTTYTAIGSERVVVSGTVNRFLRVIDDVTGTGTTTRAVVFARR